MGQEAREGERITHKERRRRRQKAIERMTRKTPLKGRPPRNISEMADEITERGHFRGMSARTAKDTETGVVIVDVEGPVRPKKGK